MSEYGIDCPNCGKKIDKRARYCRYCGHSMTQDQDKISAETQVELRRAERSNGPNLAILLPVAIVLLLVIVAIVLFILRG